MFAYCLYDVAYPATPRLLKSHFQYDTIGPALIDACDEIAEAIYEIHQCRQHVNPHMLTCVGKNVFTYKFPGVGGFTMWVIRIWSEGEWHDDVMADRICYD